MKQNCLAQGYQDLFYDFDVARIVPFVGHSMFLLHVVNEQRFCH